MVAAYRMPAMERIMEWFMTNNNMMEVYIGSRKCSRKYAEMKSRGKDHYEYMLLDTINSNRISFSTVIYVKCTKQRTDFGYIDTRKFRGRESLSFYNGDDD